MRDRVQATFHKGVSRARRAEGIEWVFCGMDDPIGFDLCAEALGAHPDNVRKRLMYEYYRKWIIFPAPLPFFAVPPSSELTSHILYQCGEGGLNVVQCAWYWPGISTEQIFDMLYADGRSATQADLEMAEETGVIACEYDNWYVTSRLHLRRDRGMWQ
jgi:hypothetical protein